MRVCLGSPPDGDKERCLGLAREGGSVLSLPRLGLGGRGLRRRAAGPSSRRVWLRVGKG